MIEFLQGIQDKISPTEGVRYVDEDWGQLDDYSEHPPVQFPCVLIDASAIDYTNLGTDRSKKPINRQQATGSITLKFADLKLTNSSSKAPLSQKQKAWSLLTLIQKVHEEIHGFKPSTNSGALIRTNHRRIKRDDGIQQYQVVYSIGLNDV